MKPVRNHFSIPLLICPNGENWTLTKWDMIPFGSLNSFGYGGRPWTRTKKILDNVRFISFYDSFRSIIKTLLIADCVVLLTINCSFVTDGVPSPCVFPFAWRPLCSWEDSNPYHRYFTPELHPIQRHMSMLWERQDSNLHHVSFNHELYTYPATLPHIMC